MNYKGFDKNLRCRGLQYEIGREYETDEARLCEKGFHSCEYPLDVFKYYPPASNRYCEVEAFGSVIRGSDKVSSTKIKIGEEIGIKGIRSATFKFIKGNSALKAGSYSALEAGWNSALEAGWNSALEAGSCSVVYGGKGSKVAGGLGSVLAIQYWVDSEFKCIKFKEVDGEKIKADTFYKLDKLGRFIEVKE